VPHKLSLNGAAATLGSAFAGSDSMSTLILLDFVSMSTQRLRTAVIGTGFVGRVHIEAIRRLGFVEIAAIADTNLAQAEKYAAEFGVPVAVSDYRTVLDNSSIETVDICTPNALHAPIAKAALEAGKHVMCEKPLATSAVAAAELVSLAAAKSLRNCTCYNLRYYPMVQQMRRMREDGDLGEILIVQGTYSQDWLLYDTDYNWRIEAKDNGPSRCVADIGSHFCDMAEHVTGQRITEVCADLQTVHKTRKKPRGQIEAFAGKTLTADDYSTYAVDTEDMGAVIFRMDNDARGAYTVSQVSAGRKNRLNMEIYGTKCGVAWDQERPDELWIGNRNTNNQLIIKDPSLLKASARSYADLPGGHSEGYDDTFKQVFRRFYGSILDPAMTPEYPQFADGLRQLTILEAELESSRSRSWVEVR
jgi:predicted dehydrogenase